MVSQRWDRESNYSAHMESCIAAARLAAERGNYPLGALVIVDGAVFDGASHLVEGHDPSAHPELVAIRAACSAIGSRYLPGGILVTTLEPCPMCTSAAIWAKMQGIVFGSEQQDAIDWARDHPHATFTWRQIEIRASTVAAAGDPSPWIMAGVERDACNELFSLVP
jgi:tRNA(Arg) A34 adenosine deaminase TadA